MKCYLVLLTLINSLSSHEIKPVLHKCCGPNEIVTLGRKCINSTQPINLSLLIYDMGIEKTGKMINETFVTENEWFLDDEFKNDAISSLSLPEFNLYLTQTGVLYFEVPNAFQRWIQIDRQDFCVDLYKTRYYLKPVFWFRLRNVNQKFEDLPVDTANETILTHFKERFHILRDGYVSLEVKFYVITISCGFLLAVLVVYTSLPELRNLPGLILVSFVTSMLPALMLFATISKEPFSPDSCIKMTLSTYFFIIASHCWMNIMSVDIWWTFRNYLKNQENQKRRAVLSYIIYSIYSWGLPLVLTNLMKWIESIDLTDKPWFIKPNFLTYGCFIQGGQKFLYLDVPLLVIICNNWLFLVMTTLKIRAILVLESTMFFGNYDLPTFFRHHRNRFHLYVKLSIMLTFNWFFEVLNIFITDIRVWYIHIISNTLIGVSVFLIFVYKRKIIKRICSLIC